MRTSITLPDGIYKKGLENAKLRGFATSFSAYLAWLIERDSAGAVAREDIPRSADPASPTGKITYLRTAEDTPVEPPPS